MNFLKSIILSGIILGSFSTMAASRLLLDASCKVSCLTSVEESYSGMGGIKYNRIYKETYLDLIGLTREGIDQKTSAEALKNVCIKAFGVALSNPESECLYFKN